MRLGWSVAGSCLTVGSKTGFRIYSFHPFTSLYNSAIGGVGIVEMLFSTSLVAVVGGGPQVSNVMLSSSSPVSSYIVCFLCKSLTACVSQSSGPSVEHENVGMLGTAGL